MTWEDALYIYDTGKELGLTHMAGSSVPVCFWRDPWLEHPIDTPLEEAIVISYGHLEACASSLHQTPHAPPPRYTHTHTHTHHHHRRRHHHHYYYHFPNPVRRVRADGYVSAETVGLGR